MNRRDSRIIVWVGIALALLGGAIQKTFLFSIYGIRADFTLAFVIPLVFFLDNFFAYFLIVLLSGMFLRFSPGTSKEIAALTFILLLVFWLRHRILWPGFVTCIFLVLLATLGFYLIISPRFLFSRSGVFAIEAAYNISLATIIYGGLSLVRSRR